MEDEPTLLRDLCEELQGAGYDAVGASDVSQAQRMLSNQFIPAMIVCDVNLPGQSGLDFLSHLRGEDLLRDVPFMLLTALSEREDVLRGKWAGADDYLVKPVDYDMLLASIASRLAQVGRMHSNYHVQLQHQANESLTQWTNVLDKVSHCALVCDARLCVRFANRAAYGLCGSAEHSPLSVSATGQIGLHPFIVNHSAIQAFIHGDEEAAKVDVAANGVSRKSWQVSLLALSDRTRSHMSARVADSESFVVFLSDPGQRQLHNKAALARRFSLTPTELQVASLLADGLTKQEMCEQMKVSATTMAYHLRNLFSKTDTNRQAELVALLMAVAWNDIALPPSGRA
ncbi:response regulator transcription factor [Diaphorobacter sp. HDW4B]|uniref:response regulator n=1 Tax=Diaphorobacter sp. HDW4B TaxID=2714925 RepID=UPI00140805AE|nr:response regulator [Diaphorobacter sp. HDW4B]QIL71834.1 response regulator transcription factor [Diaphorobacter sp. HDW4B]